MKCPYCLQTETHVLESRISSNYDEIRRRRECFSCMKRFTTYERAEPANLVIVKKDGRRETFSREKLLKGMLKACEKRPIKREKIEQAANEIESTLLAMDKQELRSKIIGMFVMEKLKKLDDVAYVRFASVYKKFRDANQFMDEIKNLNPNKNRGLLKPKITLRARR